MNYIILGIALLVALCFAFYIGLRNNFDEDDK